MAVSQAQNLLNTTNNAPFIPEIVANQALGRLGAYLSLGRTVSKDSELTTVQVGETIRVPVRGSLQSNSLAQNGDVQVQTPTSTSKPVTLDHHQEVTIAELDYTRSVQQGGSVLPGYVEDAIQVLAEDIESALAALWSLAGFNNDATSSALEDLVDMRTQLITNKVPVLAERYAYIHPKLGGKLLKANAYIDPKLIPNNRQLTEGALGRSEGFDVFEGQLVVKSGSPGVYRNMFYNRDAMVLATRPQPLPDANLGVQAATVIDGNGIALRILRSYNPSKLGVQITLDVVFGTAVLRAEHLGVLDSPF